MESVSREHIWSSECTFQTRKCNGLRQKHAMFSLFQVDPSWYENTGGVSQRRTERLIAGDVLSDGFVEPTCRIESGCCALQMQ